MATNRFPGTCKTCGAQIPAEAGELRKEQGAWVVYHAQCLPAAGPGWQTGVLGSYDCETTGRDPLVARLVSAAFVTSDGRRMRGNAQVALSVIATFAAMPSATAAQA